jgi:acyl carrier protein
MVEENCLDSVLAAIRDVCGVDGLAPDQDFYDAGVTSIQALPLLMELEVRFDVAIPDERFVTVRNPRALSAVIQELKES